MVVALRVMALLAGAATVIAVFTSALKTVIVPRADPVRLARLVFVTMRRPFDLAVRRAATWPSADRIMARFAPFSLITLPWVWVTSVLIAFIPIYWALGLDAPREAFEQSGSALLTLGFAFDTRGPVAAAMFIEASLGVGLFALLISFLPTLYQLFSRRELLVSQLDTRAGTPPTPVNLFRRAERIGWNTDDLWIEWERWFAEVEESHTSYLALPFFRSNHHARSWVTAAGAVLDSASLRASTLDMPPSWRAELCIRAGYLALRRIAGSFNVRYDPDPRPTDPVAILRDEFDDLVDELVAAGVPVKADRDQAWRDFAGWRVNYETPLLALCGLLMAPYAPWSSDRGINYRVHALDLSRRRARGRSR